MQLAEFPLNALMEITARPPLVFVRGEGSWIWDHGGKKYLDFVQGWAVNALGHSPPAIAAALAKQAALLVNPSPAFWNEPSARLARQLVDHSCFDRVFFANTGAEANEGAIKLARKWGAKRGNGAYEIITFDHAFHGRTLATMAASGKPGWDSALRAEGAGLPEGAAERSRVGRAADRRSHGRGDDRADPGRGRRRRRDRRVPARAASARDDRGLLLIVDEVQTGMGRTGKLFGYQHAGIEPDIMTLGKGIGGGVPLAALLAKEAVCCFEHGDQGGTYNGNPLMTAVGGAVMTAMLAPGFLSAVAERGHQLMDGLRTLAARQALGEVRGRGLLVALDLGRDVGGKVSDAAREAGLLLNSPRPGTLRFMPALTTSAAEIDAMLEILDGALRGVLGR